MRGPVRAQRAWVGFGRGAAPGGKRGHAGAGAEAADFKRETADGNGESFYEENLTNDFP